MVLVGTYSILSYSFVAVNSRMCDIILHTQITETEHTDFIKLSKNSIAVPLSKSIIEKLTQNSKESTVNL